MKCAFILIVAFVAIHAAVAHPVDTEQIVDQLMHSRHGQHSHGSHGNYVVFALNLDNDHDRDHHHGGHGFTGTPYGGSTADRLIG